MTETRASLSVMELNQLYGGKLGDTNECGIGTGDEGIEGCSEDGGDALNAGRECVHYYGTGKTMRAASLAFSIGIRAGATNESDVGGRES